MVLIYFQSVVYCRFAAVRSNVLVFDMTYRIYLCAYFSNALQIFLRWERGVECVLSKLIE